MKGSTGVFVRRILLVVFLMGLISALSVGHEPVSGVPASSPIQHVVILFQENHSFDNVLGYLCVQDNRCDGVTSGKTHDGQTIPLSAARDIPPSIALNPAAQQKAVNGGGMNGWDKVQGCKPKNNYACYTQFLTPRQGNDGSIPNLTALARAFAISDRTFENDFVASWVAHLGLVAATHDGFTGYNPYTPPGNPKASGWGCDSFKDAQWKSPLGSVIDVPACVPRPDGTGAYRPTPVSWVPTIMDRMDQGGLPWRIYGQPGGQSGGSAYTVTICPSFAVCLNGPQHNNVVVTDQIYTDIKNGDLPSLSLVLPKLQESQHNKYSMLEGDNYIGRVVSAIMNGPPDQWNSTAIFITYDDCGCFYDHVAPPAGLGIRVPMVIVSPYAKAGFTDSNVASFASLMAFVENTYGLPPLSTWDAGAYDYSQSFNFSQKPLEPVALHSRPLPRWEEEWLREHPGPSVIDSGR